VRRLAPPLVLVLLALLCAPGAPAATGDLSFKDCVARFVAGACTAVPNEVLEGGRDVAISPDGKLIFVADMQDSVVGFTRSLVDGSVAYASCADTAGAGDVGCTHLAANVLLQPRSVAFSPDGTSLYVAAETSDTIVRLTVGAGGALGFGGCVEDDALPDWGCATEVASLDGPLRVLVAPDGAVYAVSGEATLSHFSAGLALLSCYREVPIAGCPTQAEPLEAAHGLALGPGGKHLYVTSTARDAIAWFTRAGNGTLALGGCLADDDDTTAFSDNCAEDSGVDYNWLNHVTLNPTGTHAYATDETGLGVVYHFSRDGTTGALTRQDCLANDIDFDAPGCAELDDATGSGLAGVTDAVVSPDSANLYTVAAQDTALSTFGLSSPGGVLSHIRCLRDNAVQGCAGFGEAGLLGGPFGVAISSDGHDLYVANGPGVPALLHFEREAPGTRPGGEDPGPDPDPDPDPDPGAGGGSGSGGSGTGSTSGSPTGPPAPPTGPAAKCNGLKATIVGTAGPDSLRGTAKRDVIAAGAGNDRVQSLGGKDVVCGEGGRDRLGGGADADTLLGGPGKDVLKGAGGADRLLGGPGADQLLGGPGRDSARQ
jgi:DNA-binding beta-propeller fold protein YncE